MKELIDYIIKNVVDEPDKVNIYESEDEIGKVLNIEVAEIDKPLIIGREGRNIQAIRTIASVISRRKNEKVYIKIVD